MEIVGGGYVTYDLKGKEIGKGSGAGGDLDHFTNFINCIRGTGQLNSEIEEGQKSTLLCHLGNIAYKLGRTIDFDPETKKITNAPEAESLWGREYRKGWEPKV